MNKMSKQTVLLLLLLLLTLICNVNGQSLVFGHLTSKILISTWGYKTDATSLDLSNKAIKTFDPMTFQDFYKIQKIVLNTNSIKTIGSLLSFLNKSLNINFKLFYIEKI
jgi:hypothetical protein